MLIDWLSWKINYLTLPPEIRAKKLYLLGWKEKIKDLKEWIWLLGRNGELLSKLLPLTTWQFNKRRHCLNNKDNLILQILPKDIVNFVMLLSLMKNNTKKYISVFLQKIVSIVLLWKELFPQVGIIHSTKNVFKNTDKDFSKICKQLWKLLKLIIKQHFTTIWLHSMMISSSKLNNTKR